MRTIADKFNAFVEKLLSLDIVVKYNNASPSCVKLVINDIVLIKFLQRLASNGLVEI